MSKRQEKFRVLSVHDEAIDTERMTVADMTHYYQTRDEAFISKFLKPGSRPMWFHIGEIQRRLWASYVNALDVDSVRFERAFMAGVSMVEDVAQDDGGSLPTWVPTDRAKNGAMSEKSLERFDPGVVEEIGCVAWDHGFLARKTGRSYRLPHTSLVALSVRGFLSADASPSSQATSSAEASPDAQAMPAETAKSSASSESNCVSPTDATATEMPSATAA